MELGLVFLAFLPRRWRIACFCIVTLWQAGVILTANYAFLNYLVLALGILLLEDRTLLRFVPVRWRRGFQPTPTASEVEPQASPAPEAPETPAPPKPRWQTHLRTVRLSAVTFLLCWILYATTLPLLQLFWSSIPLPEQPVYALAPFRIANRYGLFAVMTPARYLIEFQGSDDGTHWKPYPYRYQPQDVHQPPGIYAPYQPRFDWNLWFASLGDWRQYPFVLNCEARLLLQSPSVLQLFAGNPFPSGPKYVRTIVWQYWFSTPKEKRTQGLWWTRKPLGYYAPPLELTPNGHVALFQTDITPSTPDQ